ncbi:MAG: ADP-ribosylglycohydrolase family protein [Hymenobacter sp.]
MGRTGTPDLADFGRRAINWLDNAYWTATAGNASTWAGPRARPFSGCKRGVAPHQAGPRTEQDNGNGALMHILPLAFHATWQADELDLNAAWALTEAVASVTHGHPRSTLGCFLYLLVARGLLLGHAPAGRL